MPTRLEALQLSADEERCGRIEARLPRDTVAWTPLQYACAVGDAELVSEIIAENSEAVKDSGNTNYAYSPLHIAVCFDHIAIVKLLLNVSPSKINGVDSQVGCTPLHLAILQGNEKMVRLLLDDVNIQQLESKKGTTPLELAKQLQLASIETLLIDHATRAAGQKEVSNWLASIGLVQYAPMLFDEGYDDINFLLATGGLDEKTLNAMHIPKAGHRAKLQTLYQLKEFLHSGEESSSNSNEDELDSEDESDASDSDKE